jgi:DNA-binding transcriptional LysR family regulator
MTLNLHLLRLFAAVADRQGFSRAAQSLHVSQPAVSKGVRQLEAQVGARLLERTPGGVSLTEAGAMLADHARAIFAVERAAEEELAALRGLARGSLHVGASTTIATYLLPPVLSAFYARHPDVTLRVTSANTRAIAELLVARELDVALVEGPVQDPRIREHAWRKDELIVIAAPTHAWATRRSAITVRMMARELLIVREPGSGTRDVAMAALAEHGVTPERTLQVDSTEAIKQTVAAGLGIAVVSRAATGDQLALGRLKKLTVRGLRLERRLTRLTLPGRRDSAAAARFTELI